MVAQYKGTGAVDVGAWTAPMKTQRKYADGGVVSDAEIDQQRSADAAERAQFAQQSRAAGVNAGPWVTSNEEGIPLRPRPAAQPAPKEKRGSKNRLAKQIIEGSTLSGTPLEEK